MKRMHQQRLRHIQEWHIGRVMEGAGDKVGKRSGCSVKVTCLIL